MFYGVHMKNRKFCFMVVVFGCLIIYEKSCGSEVWQPWTRENDPNAHNQKVPHQHQEMPERALHDEGRPNFFEKWYESNPDLLSWLAAIDQHPSYDPTLHEVDKAKWLPNDFDDHSHVCAVTTYRSDDWDKRNRPQAPNCSAYWASARALPVK